MADEIQLEKLELLGSLMAGLAHEVNSPLAAIRSNSELLQRAFQKIEEFLRALPETGGRRPADAIEDLLALIRETLQTQQLACERLDDLTRNVRSFTRSDAEDWKKASLRQILENALVLTAHARQGRITVTKDFGQDIEIECHPNQLGQVFINVLMNASQAIEATGEIRIRTSRDGNGGMAAVAISDTGCGMTPEVQARIFEPGFTTKAPGVGTGLGLSISLKIVENHKGRIDVQSQAGRGSTFIISVPVVQTPERKTNGDG